MGAGSDVLGLRSCSMWGVEGETMHDRPIGVSTMSDERSLSVRKAENGYVVTVSSCTGKGMKRSYNSDDYIMDDLPQELKDMMAGKIKGKKQPKKGVKKADGFDAATKKATAKIK